MLGCKAESSDVIQQSFYTNKNRNRKTQNKSSCGHFY